MEKMGRNVTKIVTLCGSTSFKEDFEMAAKNLTFNNYIVLMPHVFTKYHDSLLSERENIRLKELHKRKIDMSDAIIVINKNGCIGENTKEEIEYAKSKGKKVYNMYINCENDCAYINNCPAKYKIPYFEKKYSNRYPDCPCYCIEDK